jgi:hypothetical protein
VLARSFLRPRGEPRQATRASSTPLGLLAVRLRLRGFKVRLKPLLSIYHLDIVLEFFKMESGDLNFTKRVSGMLALTYKSAPCFKSRSTKAEFSVGRVYFRNEINQRVLGMLL